MSRGFNLSGTKPTVHEELLKDVVIRLKEFSEKERITNINFAIDRLLRFWDEANNSMMKCPSCGADFTLDTMVMKKLGDVMRELRAKQFRS